MSECCERPAIARFDHKIGETPMVNRVCTRCGRHWYGPEGDVKEYTKREWDNWINSEESA